MRDLPRGIAKRIFHGVNERIRAEHPTPGPLVKRPVARECRQGGRGARPKKDFLVLAGLCSLSALFLMSSALVATSLLSYDAGQLQAAVVGGGAAEVDAWRQGVAGSEPAQAAATCLLP